MNQNLRNASARLKFTTDRLTGLMSGLEAQLQRLGLGVEAWVALDPETRFGYTRFAKRWRLAIETAEGIQPLEEAKRRHRAAVVPLLPLLFRELEIESEKLLTQLIAACKVMEEVMAAIEREREETRA
jgi:hypothetical protein